jgi:hypothetical protein
MKKNYLSAWLIVLLAGCTQPDRQKTTPSSSPDTVTILQADPAPAIKDKVDSTVQVDSIIHLTFLPVSDSLTAKGRMDKDHSPVICYLRITRGSKLTASIEPESRPANIRFNQLFLPDGNSDGPFGQTLEYKLPQKGMYKLYIGPSLMANDAYTGDFLLHVKVE